MSNGFGPLLEGLGHIRYKNPFGGNYCGEYWLGSAWTSAENFVEIGGFEPGSGEVDSEHGIVILPVKVAAKIAAAILLAECRQAAGYIDDEHRGFFAEPLINRLAPNHEAIDTFAKLLKGILAEELAEEPA
jgi:hypothetical protein